VSAGIPVRETKEGRRYNQREGFQYLIGFAILKGKFLFVIEFLLAHIHYTGGIYSENSN
jgi:hypothetical protein